MLGGLAVTSCGKGGGLAPQNTNNWNLDLFHSSLKHWQKMSEEEGEETRPFFPSHTRKELKVGQETRVKTVVNTQFW